LLYSQIQDELQERSTHRTRPGDLPARHELARHTGRRVQVSACGVPEVGPGSLTSGDRWSDMIPACRCGCCT
jgi:hypothetical protein